MIARRWLACLALGGAVIGCSGGGEGDEPQNSGGSGGGGSLANGGRRQGPRVCTIQAPTECPSPLPVYADVAPIIAARCYDCHGGLLGQTEWPLTTARHVLDWSDGIRSVLLGCLMPPEETGIDIPDEESLLILNWLRCNPRE